MNQATETIDIGGDLGEYLKKIRLKSNISIERLSAHTKIRKDSLLAIEANEALPHIPQAYYRGYIKCYCLFFGIDPQAILENVASEIYQIPKSSYSELNTFQFKKSNSNNEDSVGKTKRGQRKHIYATLIIVGTLLFIGIQYFKSQHATPDVDDPSSLVHQPEQRIGIGSIIDMP